MAEPPKLTTLPFAQPTHCRRYEGRVAVVTGAAQGFGELSPSASPRKAPTSSLATFRAKPAAHRA